MKKILFTFLWLLLVQNTNAQWKPLEGFFKGDVTLSLAIHAPSYSFDFAVTGGDLYSLGSGNKWYQSTTAPKNIVDLLVSTNSLTGAQKIFVATAQSGVYISSNFGTAWQSPGNGLPNITLERMAVAPGSFGKPNMVFIGTEGLGIYRTTDDGANWTSVSSGQTGEALNVSDIAYYSGSSGPEIVAATNDRADRYALKAAL
jgi:hypothetical protein